MLNLGLIALSIFFASEDYPTLLKTYVAKARRYADHPQEPVFDEDEGDNAVEAEEQPDWVDVYAGQKQIYIRGYRGGL